MGLHGAGRHPLTLLPVGAPLGSGATFIAAKIPAYTVVDFASDWQVTPWLKLLAGVSNLTDRQYYDRVWQTDLEPTWSHLVRRSAMSSVPTRGLEDINEYVYTTSNLTRKDSP